MRVSFWFLVQATLVVVSMREWAEKRDLPVRCDDRIAQWINLLRLGLHPDLRDGRSLLLLLQFSTHDFCLVWGVSGGVWRMITCERKPVVLD